jgi:two-component system, LytTR family, response regulator
MNSPHTVVIVEDETLSLEALKNLLEEFFPSVKVMGTASDVNEAVKVITQLKPDIVFLDIELNPGTGFDVVSQTRTLRYAVIFTTAYEQYAIQAIRFSSVDYLLKPIDLEELSSAIDKAIGQINDRLRQQQIDVLLSNLNSENNLHRKICLASQEGLEFFNVSDILYCQANGAYTEFTTITNRKIMVSKNIKEYENMLPEQFFLRVHNRHLINLTEVKKYIRADGGSIIMNNGDTVYLSPRRKEEFLSRMAAFANR